VRRNIATGSVSAAVVPAPLLRNAANQEDHSESCQSHKFSHRSLRHIDMQSARQPSRAIGPFWTPTCFSPTRR
jgi:hypothetical protein